MAFAEGTTTTQGKQPYKYNGKELDQSHGLNQYDVSARYYDPGYGRFTTGDPLSEKYYSWSPYVYVMNNPVNAIDPDGKLVIFINGMHWDSGGKSDYWSGFDKKVMKHLKDYNAIYLDGALGGFSNIAMNKIASKRFGGGYEAGVKQAYGIFSSITDKDKKITETIKIISHSMGGAYAKGYVTALLEYCEKNGIDPSVIEFEADFAPYQPKSQKAVNGINTYQFSHSKDRIAGEDKMPGSKYMDTSSDKEQGHSISTFFNQIANLPAGNYKIVDGNIIKQ